MGMDGLSMSNTGLLREASSLEQATQAEEAMHRDENNKQVDKMQTQVKVKEDGRNSSGQNAKKKKNNDDEASVYSSSEEENENDTLQISEDDLDNHTFYVKISKDGEIFELYDKESNRLVEKISAQEINQLMLKLNMASGILVNRSV